MKTLLRTSSENKDFRSLVQLLDADLRIRDGEDHAFFAQFNGIENIGHVVVLYNGVEPLGCGAFKRFDEEKVEIKRMFVQPVHRGKGIGLEILKELEKWAAELNFSACVLETGKKQPEAISLYKKAGYHMIKNYGQYENVESSVCMMKNII